MASGSKKQTRVDDWEVEHDLSTLIEARKIQRDKDRMARVRKLAKKKSEEMDRVSEK